MLGNKIQCVGGRSYNNEAVWRRTWFLGGWYHTVRKLCEQNGHESKRRKELLPLSSGSLVETSIEVIVGSLQAPLIPYATSLLANKTAV